MTSRNIDHWLNKYSQDHQNSTNQTIHFICVPAIGWSVIGALWTIPVPSTLLQPGAWAGLAMFAALMFYFRQSRSLGIALLIAFAIGASICWLIYRQFGAQTLLFISISVFVIAWIGQFIGHHIEGVRPSFLTDLVYLLIGPAWTMSKLFKRLGIRV